MEIKCYDSHEQADYLIGITRVSLYDIACGPFTFALSLKQPKYFPYFKSRGGTGGLLSFICIMEQDSNWIFQVDFVETRLTFGICTHNPRLHISTG